MAGLPKTKKINMLYVKKHLTGWVKMFLFFYFAVSAGVVYAGVGTTGADFLNINVGGRASAFCGAYSAVSGDVYSTQYNPAGIAKIEDREIALMHNEWMLDTRFEFLAVGIPLFDSGLGLSVKYFDMGEFAGRNNFGQKIDDFTANDQSVNVSYGRLVGRRFSFGASVKYIKQTIASKSSSGFALDAGMNVELITDNLTLAVVAKNLGPKLSAYNTEKVELPQSYTVGIQAKPDSENFQLTTDMTIPKGGDAELSIGFERKVIDMLALRAGLEFGSHKEDSFNWCLGIGLHIWDYSLDYSFEPVKDLDSAHRISISVKF
ncbi:MAG: PorV/PorQ family protein [bacterium]